MKGEYFIYHHTYQISYSTNDFVEVDANSVGVHKKISLLLIKKMEKEKERGKTSNRDFRDDIGEFNGNGEDVKCMGTRGQCLLLVLGDGELDHSPHVTYLPIRPRPWQLRAFNSKLFPRPLVSYHFSAPRPALKRGRRQELMS